MVKDTTSARSLAHAFLMKAMNLTVILVYQLSQFKSAGSQRLSVQLVLDKLLILGLWKIILAKDSAVSL